MLFKVVPWDYFDAISGASREFIFDPLLFSTFVNLIVDGLSRQVLM